MYALASQAGAQRLRSAEGAALKGTFDEQTWSTLVELGAAPTPVHGQIGCYKTPRELKPSAATPPLIHSAAGLAGKQTPCSGPAGATGVPCSIRIPRYSKMEHKQELWNTL